MTRDYDDVVAFLNLIDATEDEALAALLGAFGPSQPPGIAGMWKKSDQFGRSAPPTKVLWAVMSSAGFACVECKSRLRLSIDHIDNDSTNHARVNLRLLCSRCNRGKMHSSRGQKIGAIRFTNVALYKAALALFAETGTWPREADIARRAGTAMGGSTYLMKFLRLILERGPTPTFDEDGS